MAIWALQMSGDNAILPWEGTDIAKGIPTGTLACTEAQYWEFKSKLAVFAGSAIWRWQYIADVLTELPDPRPAVTWVDTEGVGTVDGDGNITIETTDNESDPKVTLRHEDNSYKPSDPDVVKIGNRLMSLPFNDGDALLEIRSLGVPRRDTYESCDLFNMTNTFTIRVAAVKL